MDFMVVPTMSVNITLCPGHFAARKAAIDPFQYYDQPDGDLGRPAVESSLFTCGLGKKREPP